MVVKKALLMAGGMDTVPVDFVMAEMTDSYWACTKAVTVR